VNSEEKKMRSKIKRKRGNNDADGRQKTSRPSANIFTFQIDDRMTEVGFQILEDAIRDLKLPTRSDSGGEASGAKTRD
jgi:hypothetical protein